MTREDWEDARTIVFYALCAIFTAISYLHNDGTGAFDGIFAILQSVALLGTLGGIMYFADRIITRHEKALDTPVDTSYAKTMTNKGDHNV